MDLTLSILDAESARSVEILPISGVEPGFIRERRHYEFVLEQPDGSRGGDFHLLLNDVPLDARHRGSRVVFPWDTDFYAGDVRLTLFRSGKVIGAADLTTDPDLAKLTRAEYALMISEISAATQALYRMGRVTIPARVRARERRSDLVSLELVRANLDAFERAVSRITQRPMRHLRSERRRVDLLKARDISDRMLERALSGNAARPATPQEAARLPAIVGCMKGNWAPRVVETVRGERYDTYENRAILGFARWLDGDLGRIAARIGLSGNDRQQGPDRLADEARLDRIGRWRSRLRTISASSMFAGLTPDPHLHRTTVFGMQPDYAAAFSSMVKITSGLGNSADTVPAVPIDRTYALYELWCYVRLLEAAAEAFPACLPRLARLLKNPQNPGDLAVRLATDDASILELDDRTRVVFQRDFTPRSSAVLGAGTKLVDCRPDVSIERTDASGRIERIVLLDPKYRKGESLRDGVRDMHVYHDAIVSTSGGPVVISAAALTTSDEAFVGPPERLPSAVGVIGIRPGSGKLPFISLLKASLTALATGSPTAA